jgi:transcriptional regulator with PAS, ATPase and Fis domain
MINSIRIPPVRERIADLPMLAERLLAEESKKTGKTFGGFSEDFFDYLKDYSFPDNVQELRTIIAGSLAVAESDTITVDNLPSYIRETIEHERVVTEKEFRPRRLEDVIRDHVERTLEHFGRDKEIAARELGISLDELDRITHPSV